MDATYPSVVITSLSSAEQYWFCLGLYRWDDEKNCYHQVDNYTSERFLYRVKNGSWYISNKVGKMIGFMKNSSKTSSVPLKGWMVYDSTIKDFHKDISVKIKFGELTEDVISARVRVQFRGALRNPYLDGDYEMTDKFVHGKPIYKNKYGATLFSCQKGWSIVSPDDIILSKSENGFCPTQSCTFMGPFPTGTAHGSLDDGMVKDALDKIDDNHKRYINIIITKVFAENPPVPVCISTPDTLTEIRSDDVIENKIHAETSHEQYLVISGDGKGKQLRGDCLGMYRWVPEDSFYIQVSTEEHLDEAKRRRRYLYQADDDCWYVSKDPGKKKGSLKNFSKSSLVPLEGWMFMTKKSKLIRDSSAKIEIGRLPQDDGCVTISLQLKSPAVRKFPRCSGNFIKRSKYYCGRPVYEKNDGMILYCSDDVKWCIGDKIGIAFIRSSEAGWSPTGEETWTFWDDSKQNYLETDIVIHVDFY